MFGWLKKLLANVRGHRKQLGNRGEIAAAEFLQGIGYRILYRQFRNRFGELDLIALDGQTIVFVEVKTRAQTIAGHPTESITLTKQRHMTRAALAFLKSRRWLTRPSRFDVISILWIDGDKPPRIDHYKNAFEPTGRGQMFS